MLTDVYSSSRERHYSYHGLLMTLAEDEKHNMVVWNWYSGRTVVRQEFPNGQIVSYEHDWNPAGTYADSATVNSADGETIEAGTASSVPNSVKHLPKYSSCSNRMWHHRCGLVIRGGLR